MLNKLKTYLVNGLKACAALAFLAIAVGGTLLLVVPIAFVTVAVLCVTHVVGLIAAVGAFCSGTSTVVRHSTTIVNGKTVMVDGNPVDREPEPEKPDTPEAKAPVNPENQEAAQ